MDHSAQQAHVRRRLLRTYQLNLMAEKLDTKPAFFSKSIVLRGELDSPVVLRET